MKSDEIKICWINFVWQLNYQNTFSMRPTNVLCQNLIVSNTENIFWRDNGIAVLNARYSFRNARSEAGWNEDGIDYFAHFLIVILC